MFWATWCPYCRAFMPYLAGIQKDYAAQGVKIVAINAKEDGRGDPKAYMQGLGFAPISVANGDAIAKSYGVEYIPGLLIVDGAGVVAYRRPVDRSARRQDRRRAVGRAGSRRARSADPSINLDRRAAAFRARFRPSAPIRKFAVPGLLLRGTP